MDLSVKTAKNILGGETNGCRKCDCNNCPTQNGYDLSASKSKGRSDGYSAMGQ